MFRVYRRDISYQHGFKRKWELRAAFINKIDAETYAQNKVDAIPCDVVAIEWKIMQSNRNIRVFTNGY